jgi:hypothetical protein
VMTAHLGSAVHGGINAKLPRRRVKLLRQRAGLVAKHLGHRRCLRQKDITARQMTWSLGNGDNSGPPRSSATPDRVES